MCLCSSRHIFVCGWIDVFFLFSFKSPKWSMTSNSSLCAHYVMIWLNQFQISFSHWRSISLSLPSCLSFSESRFYVELKLTQQQSTSTIEVRKKKQPWFMTIKMGKDINYQTFSTCVCVLNGKTFFYFTWLVVSFFLRTLLS